MQRYKIVKDSNRWQETLQSISRILIFVEITVNLLKNVLEKLFLFLSA